MKILVSRLPESVLCTLPNGEQVEITMLSAEGEDVLSEPDIQIAVDMLFEYSDFLSSTV